MSRARMRSLLLLVNDVQTASRFYTHGLGIPLIHKTENTAELNAGAVTISLQSALGNEAALSTGYSPFLNFDVRDMDTTIYGLLELGARLDGPIQYPVEGKIAAVRSPDGHMIGLFEPAQPEIWEEVEAATMAASSAGSKEERGFSTLGGK
eukprot:gene5754-13513_t